MKVETPNCILMTNIEVEYDWLKKGDATGSEFPLLQRGQGNFELMLDLKACPRRPQSVATKKIRSLLLVFQWGRF